MYFIRVSVQHRVLCCKYSFPSSCTQMHAEAFFTNSSFLRAAAVATGVSTILLRCNTSIKQSASLHQKHRVSTPHHSRPTSLMPTLPTTRRMLLDQIPHHPLASLPPFTKFPHHPSIVGTRPFSWVFPRSSRRSREILQKTQTAVVAISRLGRTQDVHRAELIERDVHGAVRTP